MSLDKMKSRMPLFWILHVSGWLIYSGLTLIFNYRGMLTDVPKILFYLRPYFIGFLACIPLRYFYRRIHFHEQPLKHSVLTALAASFIAANIWLGIDIALNYFFRLPLGTLRDFVQAYALAVLTRGIPLLGWTSLYFGINIWRAWKGEEERMEKANSLARDAQLQMLRYQINPHFLFNSMNSIRALIDEDETRAREMITELSEFLRYSLDSKSYADVPLKKEIEAIQHYFAIQKKRYEDKLEVLYDIEPQAGEFPVLSFLIHPLAENAIKYGMRTSLLPLTVRLKAKIRGGLLTVEVCNTGKWVEPPQEESQTETGTGTGLANVRLRLENAFPGRHRFEVVENEEHVCVKLEIQELRGTEDEALQRSHHR
jgi:two-component system LytT family sensor kinase